MDTEGELVGVYNEHRRRARQHRSSDGLRGPIASWKVA